MRGQTSRVARVRRLVVASFVVTALRDDAVRFDGAGTSTAWNTYGLISDLWRPVEQDNQESDRAKRAARYHQRCQRARGRHRLKNRRPAASEPYVDCSFAR
jgi:hypothetical protein